MDDDMVESAEKFYSRHAERYARRHDEDDWSEDLKNNLSMFSKMADERVLDAGCGPGNIADFLSEKGLDVIGIDLAGNMIEFASQNRKGDFIKMDISELDFKAESFDGIWCGSTIFFLKKDKMKETLAEFNRVLKDRSILYVDFKEGDGLCLKEKWDGEVEEYRVNQSEAKQMLKENGFEVLEFVEWENSSGANYLEFLCRKVESKQSK